MGIFMKKISLELDKVSNSLDNLGYPKLSTLLDEVANTLDKIAKTSETEVERLLKKMLPGTPFAGKAKAVGGYPRDEYMSHLKGEEASPKDLDIVVGIGAGGAEKLAKFVHTELKGGTYTPRAMGEGYPIWQLVFHSDVEYKGEKYETNGAVIEFADAMQERYPDPNSRQRETVPSTIEEDVKRRDFTVNMLLKDLTTGEIEDLTGTSKKDVENGVLRGHPEVPLDKMFNEDPLRMLRLVRFNAKYGWKVPKDVIRAVQKNADRIKIVSAERIYGELEKILKLGKLHQAVKFMSVCGLLSYILPEVRALKGVEQDSRHHNEGDVYRHTMMVLKNAPLTIQGQMAALLHDIGKPKSQEYIDGKIKFLGHEEVGAEMTEAILERMKFPKDIADSVTRIVRHHMRPHHLNINGNPSERSIRKFIGEVGDDLEDVLAQALADRQGMLPYIPDVEELKEKVKAVQEKNKALGVDPTKLPLNGSEVMEALNIPRGPMVGEALRLLKTLQDDYLTEGKVLDKDTAILLLRKHFSSQSSHD